MSDKSKTLVRALLDSLNNDISSGNIPKAQVPVIKNVIESLNSFSSLSSATDSSVDKEALELAEKFKNEGNSALSSDNYPEAISLYKKAIEIVPNNAIYHANLSAAFLAAKISDDAKKSAQTAVDLDPKYAKGYIRLANAESAAGNREQAIKAIKKGLESNPGNASLESHLKTLSEEQPKQPSPPASGSSSPFGNLPGGLAGLMNNPEMMRMAQQMMSNGNFAELMKSPQVAELMKNPQQIAEMMKNFRPASRPQ